MLRVIVGFTAVCLLSGSLAGCGAAANVVGALQDDEVTVRLVNTADDSSVEGRLLYHEDQNILESVLTEVSAGRSEREFDLGPGETSTFSDNCDDLQAIMIENADLQLLGGFGPNASTDVFRDGDDFNCGDTITFTFSPSALLTELDIDFNAQ